MFCKVEKTRAFGCRGPQPPLSFTLRGLRDEPSLLAPKNLWPLLSGGQVWFDSVEGRQIRGNCLAFHQGLFHFHCYQQSVRWGPCPWGVCSFGQRRLFNIFNHTGECAGLGLHRASHRAPPHRRKTKEKPRLLLLLFHPLAPDFPPQKTVSPGSL